MNTKTEVLFTALDLVMDIDFVLEKIHSAKSLGATEIHFDYNFDPHTPIHWMRFNKRFTEKEILQNQLEKIEDEKKYIEKRLKEIQ